jgi:hypothetical protein
VGDSLRDASQYEHSRVLPWLKRKTTLVFYTDDTAWTEGICIEYLFIVIAARSTGLLLARRRYYPNF